MKTATLAAAALAALAAAPNAAMAQASKVELYGRLDQTVSKLIGTKAKSMQNGSGNRLGVLVNEDLGDGWAALANMEHGLNGDTGAQTDTRRFWNRRVFVGLKSPFGTVQLGRDYTSAYSAAQVRSDPFAHTMVSSMLRIGTGDIGIVRYDDSVKYYHSIGPVFVSAHVAEADTPLGPTVDRPWSAALGYQNQSVYLAYGMDNPGGVNDRWGFATGIFSFGPAKLYLAAGDGKTNANAKTRSALVGATYAFGPAELRFAYGQLENRTAGTKLMQKSALGLFYSLSKRTVVYTNLANDSKAATEKSGYEVGLLHMF